MDYPVARRKMVQEQLVARGITDPRVLEVMGRIPRHLFVDPGLASQAYEDRPLQIGFYQTISQPFMVALMTQALQLKGSEKILEIGTGCGYQTAVLCELTQSVSSIERIKDLSNRARKLLYGMGYVNFELKIGDGTLGWPEKAPFGGILVTAAAEEIPFPYREQLANGGRLVIPIGNQKEQDLVRITKKGTKFLEERLTPCRFVKLFGHYGWHEEGK